MTPDSKLEKLPPKTEKVETIKILRQANRAATALAELKGIAKTIPNQLMLVNAIVLQEAKDSSEIENIITTQDELYKAIAIDKSNISAATKEVVNYRKAIFLGFDLVEKQGFLGVNDIKSIQQVLVGNSAGIRNVPGTVLKNRNTGEVVYTPPQDEIEIIDLHIKYNELNNLKVEIIGRGVAWLDTGTPDSLLDAANFIHAVEKRQGTKIACLEEIAYLMKFISIDEYYQNVEKLPNCDYKNYCLKVIKEYRK